MTKQRTEVACTPESVQPIAARNFTSALESKLTMALWDSRTYLEKFMGRAEPNGEPFLGRKIFESSRDSFPSVDNRTFLELLFHKVEVATPEELTHLQNELQRLVHFLLRLPEIGEEESNIACAYPLARGGELIETEFLYPMLVLEDRINMLLSSAQSEL